MAKVLIIVGIILFTTGLLWPWFSKLGLGKLPGDLVIERGNFKCYAPITTSILLSVVTWLLQKL